MLIYVKMMCFLKDWAYEQNLTIKEQGKAPVKSMRVPHRGTCVEMRKRYETLASPPLIHIESHVTISKSSKDPICIIWYDNVYKIL